VEKLPEVGVNGETNLKRVRVAGDLAGVPSLKFSADSGARAVRAFLAEGGFDAHLRPVFPVSNLC
jgi:hypothetical protein